MYTAKAEPSAQELSLVAKVATFAIADSATFRNEASQSTGWPVLDLLVGPCADIRLDGRFL
jgi:hypothetical protein